MLNPNDLIDAIVTKLRAIPALVTELGGDATRIVAYKDSFPVNVDYQQAVLDLPPPGILVAWVGSMPTGGNRQTWEHQFRLALRSKAEATPSAGYGALVQKIVDGVPTGGDGLKFLFTAIDSRCHEIGGMSFSRSSILRETNPPTILDYFEATFSLKQRGE